MSQLHKIGKFVCLFAIAVFIFNGCATILQGSSQKVSFSSEPSGAKVYVNGQFMGNAPLELKLEVKHSYAIEFRKEGYESKTVQITNSVGAGWVVVDVLFGLVPVIVDAATESWYSLDQDHVNGALEQQQAK
jgi:hypothetical protein